MNKKGVFVEICRELRVRDPDRTWQWYRVGAETIEAVEENTHKTPDQSRFTDFSSDSGPLGSSDHHGGIPGQSATVPSRSSK